MPKGMLLCGALLALLVSLPAPAARAEDDYYTVWTRGGPTVEPSGLKDYGWAERGDRFISTVQASASGIQIVNKFIKQGRVEKHVVCDLTFTAPPAQLRVGDDFQIVVKGSCRRLDRQAPYAEGAYVRVVSGNLRFDQRFKLCEATPDLSWTISGKVTGRPQDEFPVVAQMGKGEVTWTYRAQRVPVRPEDRGGAVGVLFHVNGDVSVMPPAGVRWQPARQGDPVRIGSVIRTSAGGGAILRFNRPSEDGGDHLILGGDTMFRIEDLARPEREGFLRGIVRFIRRSIRRTHAADAVRIRAGDITFTPEGTDYVLARNPDAGIVACFVSEGRVRMAGPAGEQAIAAGQQLVVTRGRPGPIQAMTVAQWSALTARLGLPSPGGTGPAPDQPQAFRVEAQAVRFYESGQGTPPLEQRVYRTRFPTRSARYVNWELELAHGAPGRQVDFAIEARWVRPDGSQLTVHTLQTHVQPGWTDSRHTYGWGSPDPGTWQPGWYRVDFVIGGQVVARGSFEILP